MSNDKGKNRELDFITYDGKPTNKDPNLRNRVRSHVTRLQHRKAREKKKFLGVEPLHPEGAPDHNPERAEIEEVGIAAVGARAASSASTALAGNESSASSSGNFSVHAEGAQVTQTQIVLRLQPRRIPNEGGLSHVSPESLVQAGRLASNVSRQNALQDPNDQMARILARLQLDFPTVMEHYKWIVFVQSVSFEAIFMPTHPRGTGYETLTSRIIRDPALVGTAVLVATGHILSIRNTAMSRNVARCIFELKSFVLSVVNEALRDPQRACSDPLICAVLILASHEGLQDLADEGGRGADYVFPGSVKNFHVHMRGLVQMINLRGGLSRLNETQKWLEEYVRWQDTNVSTIMGCAEPYWKQTKNQTEGLPEVKANPAMWLLKEV